LAFAGIRGAGFDGIVGISGVGYLWGILFSGGWFLLGLFVGFLIDSWL